MSPRRTASVEREWARARAAAGWLQLSTPKPEGCEKSGTSIYGFSATAEEPAMQEQNTVLCELHLQKQLLWLFFFHEQFRCSKNNIL